MRKIWGYGVTFSKKRKLCMHNLTKERKQPPVVILHQAIFYKIFILRLWLRTIRMSNLGVQFMNFPSQIFLTILIMVTEQLYWRKILLADSVLYSCGCLLLLWKGAQNDCALQLYRTSLNGTLSIWDIKLPCL